MRARSGWSATTPSPRREQVLQLAEHVAVGVRVGAAPVLHRQELVLRPDGVRHDLEPGGVRVADQRRRRRRRPVGGPRQDLRLVRAEDVRVLRDLPEAGRCRHLGVRRGVTGDDVVVRPRRRAGARQLHQRHLRAQRAQVAQVGLLEGLHVDGALRLGQAGRAQGPQQRLLEAQPDAVEVGGVLGLRRHADRPAGAPARLLHQRQHLVEGRDEVAAVEDGVLLPHERQPLLGAQAAQLAEGEVLGEPAGHRDPVDELRGPALRVLGTGRHVGRPADLVLVAGHQDAVLRGHEVGLDDVRALADREVVRRERVLRPVAGGTAVAEDERGGGRRPRIGGCAGGLRRADRDGGGERQGGEGEGEQGGTTHGGLLGLGVPTVPVRTDRGATGRWTSAAQEADGTRPRSV